MFQSETVSTLRRVVIGLALVGLVSTGAACSESGPASPAPAIATTTAALPDRDPALAKRLVAEEHAIILDVRTPGEYAGGAVPGAVNIPVQAIDKRMDEVAKLTGGDKNHAIVVYCRSGRRSGIAKEQLLAAGYTRVTNLGPKENWR